MKKKISAFLALTLTVSMMAGCSISKNPAADEDYKPEVTSTVDDSFFEKYTTRNVGAAYETFPADTVVATVNGLDVTWEEYFYYALSALLQIEASKPIESFDDDFSGISYGDYLKLAAESNIIEYRSIEYFAGEEGITLSDEAKEAMEAQKQADIEKYSEDGTEEGLYKYLGSMLTSKEMYNYFNTISMLMSEGFVHYCGANGEKVTEEDAIEFGELNGLLVAKHILISTVDDEGNPIDDAAKAEKLALAEDLIAQLEQSADASYDFDVMVAEYGEDPGMAYYPSGYCFAAGQMVPEFETATQELKVGEFTHEPVESDFGYHIIMRCPISGTDVPMGQQQAQSTLLQLAASYKYNVILDEWKANSTIEYVDGIDINFGEIFTK